MSKTESDINALEVIKNDLIVRLKAIAHIRGGYYTDDRICDHYIDSHLDSVLVDLSGAVASLNAAVHRLRLLSISKE